MAKGSKLMKIAVINQKGGVGKSTVSVNLAYNLAVYGKKVLILDVDPQGHSSVIFCNDISINGTIKELFIDRTCQITDLIKPAQINCEITENLFIIPSNIHLATTPEQIAGRTHREKILDRQLKQIKDNYDFVLIDCPPTLGILAANAVYTADMILIPTNFGRYSLDGIADLFEMIKDVKEKHDTDYRILRNMYDSRNKLSNEFTEKQLEPFKENMLKTMIRKNEAINQAQMNGETIFTFDPKSHGAEDFNLLTKEIISYA